VNEPYLSMLCHKLIFIFFFFILHSYTCQAQFNAPEDTFAFAKITLLNVDHSGYTGNIQLIGTKPGRKYTATLKKGYAKVKLPFNDVYTIRWKGIDNHKTLRIGDFPYLTHAYKSYTYRSATINFHYQTRQGKPLPNEKVLAKGINRDTVYSATTDENGNASLLVPFEDAYSMSVKYRPDFKIIRARELGQDYTKIFVKLVWRGSKAVDIEKAYRDSLDKENEIRHEEYLKELEKERIRDSIHRAIDLLSEKEKYFEKVLKLQQSTVVDLRKDAPPFTKEEALADYKKSLIDNAVDENLLNWTGSRENCKAGEISAQAKENFLVHINYYRRMTGVWDGVYWNDEKSKNCQKCALMGSVNGTINHHPPSCWSCYSQEGASACGYSNLSLGSMDYSLGHVSMYIDDFGDNNYSVGHRRWLLNPRANEMGIGATDDRTAIAVFPAYSKPQHKEVRDDFVAWPPRGYVPYRIIFPRWSFGIEDGHFEDAKVEMLDKNGQKIKLTTLKQSQGYGVPTIVWEPKFERMEKGQRYEVVISNVKVQGERFLYRYWVEAI